MEPEQIFLSHTRKDYEFCTLVAKACTEAGLFPYQAEFDTIDKPAWKNIKKEIQKSCALILVAGKKLIEFQQTSDPNWRYTQNWIAYEIGLAHQLGIDVWVICDDVPINFPVPYLNNYLPNNLRKKVVFDFIVERLNFYTLYPRQPFPARQETTLFLFECPFCENVFNLHLRIPKKESIECPTCLKSIEFPEGFPE